MISSPVPTRRTRPASPEAQLPPHSDEAEQGLVGCLLLGAPIDGITASVFYDQRCRLVFSCIRAMHADGDGPSVDSVTVSERLKRDGHLDAIGGAQFLTTCEDKAPTQHNAGYWLGGLREYADRRELLRLGTAAVHLAQTPGADVGLAKADFLATARTLIERDTPSAGFTIRQPDDLLGMAFSDADNLLGDRLWATGQPLVIAGASAIGKSRLLLQLAAASIAGREFLGLVTRGENRRWLILQAENTNRRLKADLEHLRDWIGPDGWARVNELLSIHTLESDRDSFVALDDPATVARLAKLIADMAPDCVGFDSLYNFAIGDLNRDEDMRSTLTAISRLVKTGNPERAPVVLHHAITGKAGAAKATGFDRASFGRNSKVLHAWARGQVNVAPGSPDSNEVLVLACGKCSNGREFEPFAVRLNPKTLIYEPEPGFDFRAWQGELSGKTDSEPLTTPERVRELCRPAMSRADLAKAIQRDSGCARQVSYRYIIKAERARTIRFNKAHEHFSPA